VPSHDDEPNLDALLLVPEEISDRWAALAIGFRFQQEMLRQVHDPVPTANFAQANGFYPFEKVSDWCLGYLSAALEHALLWADFTQPLTFTEDHKVVHQFRPAQTLGRATLEAASQAVWILGAGSARECAQRHLRLIRWDYDERRKSLPLEQKSAVTDADKLLLARAKAHFEPDELTMPNGYLFIVREAAAIAKADPQEIEAIWRAASGSAHGRRWPAHVLQEVIPGEEYEAGQHRTLQIPDPQAITRVISAASEASMQGVLRYLHSAGVDINVARERAIRRVGALLPLKPGIDRGDLLRRRLGEF
jgi:hypothetical protein